MSVTMNQFTLIFGVWMGLSLGDATVDDVSELFGQFTGASVLSADVEFLFAFLDHKAPSSVIELSLAQLYNEAYMHYAIFTQSKHYGENCSFMMACHHYFSGRMVVGHC